MDETVFRQAISELEDRSPDFLSGDDDVEAELHTWLDGVDEPLAWADIDHVTDDEWFFVSTLYGEMTMDGQRTHIRKYFPSLFLEAADGDIRNFHPGMPEFAGLRSGWMSKRLCQMGGILRDRDLQMSGYSDHLRQLETAATPANPMPALDAIIADHRATGWKTLSVYIRDCVGGNCFPIDSRVERVLGRYGLPVDERELVSHSIQIGRNPREIARLFYNAGASAG